MKYEPVFGDQLAFDGMMPDCEFIVGTYGYKIKDGKCFYCEKYNHKYGWSPTGDAAKELSPVIAMRRIIAEPKRWTVEDQKAGILRIFTTHYYPAIYPHQCKQRMVSDALVKVSHQMDSHLRRLSI